MNHTTQGLRRKADFEIRRMGLLLFLATVVMLFTAFTSAYIVRRGGMDWQPLPLPGVIWLNTGVLLLSCLTLEMARAARQRWRWDWFRDLLLLSALLGAGFLLGQLFAWRRLAAEKIYVSSSPVSSFFYVLTGVHGVHLLGGVLALVYVLVWSRHSKPTLAEHDAFKLCTVYWHFVGAVWLYVLFMLKFL